MVAHTAGSTPGGAWGGWAAGVGVGGCIVGLACACGVVCGWLTGWPGGVDTAGVAWAPPVCWLLLRRLSGSRAGREYSAAYTFGLPCPWPVPLTHFTVIRPPTSRPGAPARRT